MKSRFRDAFVGSVFLGALFLNACSTKRDLSRFAPYSQYAGASAVLKTEMPLDVDFKDGKISRALPAGERVRIGRIFILKQYLFGPIAPSFGVRSRIVAEVEYSDPATGEVKKWEYPIGSVNGPLGGVFEAGYLHEPLQGYEVWIRRAPWEPSETPPWRYVGKDGKGLLVSVAVAPETQ